jgi:beta-phosphoglucomutase-like phosphatase (HAD superfamily)
MTVFTSPERRYAGYIFDCDGTLANSMPNHYRAWADTVEKYGGQMPEELFYALGGWPSNKMVEHLTERFGSALDPEIVAFEKEHLYVERIAKIQPIPEVAEFARHVSAFAKVSVASGGVLPVVTRTLEVIGFKDFFPVIVTSEQVNEGSLSLICSSKPRAGWAFSHLTVWFSKTASPDLRPRAQPEWTMPKWEDPRRR